MSLRIKTAAAAAAFALLLCGCGSDIDGKSTLQSVATLPTAAESEAEKEAAGTVMTCSMPLYSGETRTLDFTAAKDAAEPEIVSSDESVVSVSGRSITANKCGSAQLTVTVADGDASFVTKVNVDVRYSRFDSSVEYTAGGVASEADAPGLVLHTEVKKGSSLSLAAEGGNAVTYTSSDEKVAKVSADGTVTAEGEGSAVITAAYEASGKTTELKADVTVYKSRSTPLPESEINEFFSQSVFIGCSLGVGHMMYLDEQGEDYLGSPLYLALSSYGIYNDDGRNGPEYQLSYNGVTAPARELLAMTDAKRVFINLGTNDMYGDAEYVSETFIEYLDGIRKDNPDVAIYLEALTPVYIGSETEFLNNDNVDALNAILKEYCDSHPDVYYIDISTIMKDDNGGLKDEYTSDYYVHLNDAAYEAWTKKLISTVRSQLIYEQRAEDAVTTYEEAGTETALADARAALKKLEDSAYKSALESGLPA